MAKIRQPVIVVKYNDTDITRNISKYITNLRYEDNHTGESDTAEITLDNRDLRWINSWYPVKGDKLEIDIYFEGIHLPCGEFEVDEIEPSGFPDVITLRGIATKFNNNLREEKTRAFENVTLAEIVREIADESNMATYIEIKEDLQLSRVEQNQKNDLAFLGELAGEYDISFKATGNTLYFISTELLHDRPYTYIMRRRYSKSYSFRDKTHKVYKGVVIEYFDIEAGEKKEYTEDWECPRSSADYLRVKKNFESEADAKKKALSLKRQNNGGEKTGGFSCGGNAKLLAGMVLRVEGWGVYDGNWFIEKTCHNINRDAGYTTSMEIKRV